MQNPYAQHAYKAKSREDVVLEYAPLVKHIANRLAARLPDSLLVDDLIQAGMIGLLDAIEKYDPGREAQFRTYAEFRIKGAMLDDLRAGDWIPRSVRETADKIEQAHQALVAELGRRPEEAELAARLAVSLPEYHEMLRKSRAIPLLQIEDLKARWKDDEGNIYDLLEDPSFTNPLEALSLHDLKDRLADAIADLPEKEQLVLSLYYDDELNLKEIGQVLGLTESRVSQIRTQAILRLRASLKTSLTSELIDAVFQRRSL